MGLFDFLGTNPQDQYKDTVQAQTVGLSPEQLQQQQEYQAMLKAQAAGTGPSLASRMLANNADTTAGNAVGLAASQRGINPGMAYKQALDAGNAARAQAGQQAATARVGEQLGAEQQFGNQTNVMQNQATGVQEANQKAGLGAAGINADLASGAAKNNAGITGSIIGAMGQGAAAVGSMGGMAHGGVVPGKAPVKGDSPVNDNRVTVLSPEEVVIPRSVSMHPGFHEKLEEIVREMPGKGPQGFAKVLAARKGHA